MREVVTLVLDLTLGLALGAVFYGGLWWTVRRLAAKQIGPWLMGSFAVRTLVVLSGFYTIMSGPLNGIFCCVAGFLAARVAVARFTRTRSTASAGTVA